jgi:hypothetical protein
MALISLTRYREFPPEETIRWTRNKKCVRLIIGNWYSEQVGLHDGDRIELLVDPEEQPQSVVVAKASSGGWMFRSSHKNSGVAVIWLPWTESGFLFPDQAAAFVTDYIQIDDNKLILGLPTGRVVRDFLETAAAT